MSTDTERREKRTPRCVVCGGISSFTGTDGRAYCVGENCVKRAPVRDRLDAADNAERTIGRRPSPEAGAIRGGEYDVRDREGGESWEYHEPQLAETLHHDSPITINGRTHFQRSPTVYSHMAPMASPRTAKRVARELTEAEAQRAYRDLVLGAVDVVANVAPGKIAKAMHARRR